ncbi:hypothetical protein DMN91_004288, partial [Ooceraea biroi]
AARAARRGATRDEEIARLSVVSNGPCRARPPARIPLDFRRFQCERAADRDVTRRQRTRRTSDVAHNRVSTVDGGVSRREILASFSVRRGAPPRATWKTSWTATATRLKRVRTGPATRCARISRGGDTNEVHRAERRGASEGGGKGSERGRGSRRENEWREDMSAVESALDVLSRAATMVQGQSN